MGQSAKLATRADCARPVARVGPLLSSAAFLERERANPAAVAANSAGAPVQYQASAISGKTRRCMRFDALFRLSTRAFRGATALLVATILVSCASVRQPAAVSKDPIAHPAVAPVAAASDLMAKLLTAQFALQNSDLDTGAKGYADAALLSNDPDIAEEATRLGLTIRNWPLARQSLARWQTLAPKDPGVLQARAWIALGEGRSDDALTDLDALAARGDEQGWRLVAQTLLGAEDKAAAAKLLERVATPAHLSDRESSWIAVSQLAFKLGDKASAKRIADGAVQRFHGSDGYAWSARLAIDSGDKPLARSLYGEALKRDPKSVRLRGGYAALLADAGDNAGAARALAQGPQDDVTYAARAAYAARADDKAALTSLYRELDNDKSARTGSRLFLLGQVAELLEKREDALAWYREIGEDDEHWFDAQTREAVVQDQLGRTDQALEFLRELQAQTGEDSVQLGNVFMLEADLLARKGRLDESTRGVRTCARNAARRLAAALCACAVLRRARGSRVGRKGSAPRDPAQARRRRSAQRARLYARRSHRASRRSARAHRARVQAQTRRARDHRQPRLDPLSHGRSRRVAERPAPRVREAGRSGNRGASWRSALGQRRPRRSASRLGTGPQEGREEQGVARKRSGG